MKLRKGKEWETKRASQGGRRWEAIEGIQPSQEVQKDYKTDVLHLKSRQRKDEMAEAGEKRDVNMSVK